MVRALSLLGGLLMFALFGGRGGVGAPPVVWNPATAQSMNITNGGLTATAPANVQSFVLSTKLYNAGKYYFECVAGHIGTSNDVSFGIGTGAGNCTLTNNSGNWYINGGVVDGAPGGFHVGDVIGTAIDFGAGKIWWSLDGNFAYAGGNPAAGTGNPLGFAVGAYNLMGLCSANNDAFTAAFKLSQLQYAPPAGFSAAG